MLNVVGLALVCELALSLSLSRGSGFHQQVPVHQTDDLVSLGKLIICLACKSAAAAQNLQVCFGVCCGFHLVFCASSFSFSLSFICLRSFQRGGLVLFSRLLLFLLVHFCSFFRFPSLPAFA